MAFTFHMVYAAKVCTVLQLCSCGIDCISAFRLCVCVCVCVVYPLFRAHADQFAFFGSESCGRLQDQQNGVVSDRPEDMVDAFHTFFGIAALS